MWESLFDYGRSSWLENLRTPYTKALDIAIPNFFEKNDLSLGGGGSNNLYHEGAPNYMDHSQPYHGHFKLGNFHWTWVLHMLVADVPHAWPYFMVVGLLLLVTFSFIWCFPWLWLGGCFPISITSNTNFFPFEKKGGGTWRKLKPSMTKF